MSSGPPEERRESQITGEDVLVATAAAHQLGNLIASGKAGKEDIANTQTALELSGIDPEKARRQILRLTKGSA
jgi:hypothetical protein